MEKSKGLMDKAIRNKTFDLEVSTYLIIYLPADFQIQTL